MSALRSAIGPVSAVLLSVLSACGEDPGPGQAVDADDDPSTEEAPVDGEDTDQDGVTSRSDGGVRPVPGKADAASPASKPTDDAGAGTTGGSGAPDDDDDGGTTAQPGPTSASCLDGVEGYDKAGPFKFAAKTAGSVKLWVPEVPAGCKVPVVHLANGTGASCSSYKGVLDRLASHGFLTTCFENTNTGGGDQGLMALETAFDMFPDLAAKKIGSTGHSQGGQGAFTVLQLAEAKWGADAIYAGLAMQPASGFGTQPTGGSWQSVYAKIKSPMFMFSGTADTLVSAAWVQRGFDALSKDIEAYNWSAIGATHVPPPTAATQAVSIPWFRWKLLGDKKACEAFKALPGNGKWDEVKKQNDKGC